MHFQRPEQLKKRVFSPRILVYVILLLIAAWWLNRFDKMRQNQITLLKGQVPTSAELLAVSNANDGAASSLPLLVVISLPDEEVRDVVARVQRSLSETCRVVLLTTGTDLAGIRQVFQAEEVPVAILYDKDNQELARAAGPVTVEALDALAAKCSREAL